MSCCKALLIGLLIAYGYWLIEHAVDVQFEPEPEHGYSQQDRSSMDALAADVGEPKDWLTQLTEGR